MTELTLDNYKEENNAHVILIRMFSDMKKKLIGMSFTTPEEYKIFYDTILFYRDKIHDFYFDNIEQLGEVFTHVEEGDEHNEEKVGEYSALHKLLTEEHKNGHGSIQYIDFKESETFSLHHVFISLIYGKNGVVRGYLDEVYMNGDREIEESLRDLHLYYLSQLLWSIATIEEEAQHEGLIDYTQ